MNTYDPGKITFSALGQLITGFADGTMINAARNEEQFSVAVGSAGEVARVRNRNRSGRVTVTLMATAPANTILAAAVTLDELRGNGIGPLLVKDLGGTTLISAPNCWIVKPPDVEFAKEMSSREWIFECDELEIFAGGAQ